jgi:hypothetical protein
LFEKLLYLRGGGWEEIIAWYKTNHIQKMKYYLFFYIAICSICCNSKVDNHEFEFYNYIIDEDEIRLIKFYNDTFVWPLKKNEYRVNLIVENGNSFKYKYDEIADFICDTIIYHEFSLNFFKEVVITKNNITFNLINEDLRFDTIVENFRTSKEKELNLIAKYSLDILNTNPYNGVKLKNSNIYFKTKKDKWISRQIANENHSRSNFIDFIRSFLTYRD